MSASKYSFVPKEIAPIRTLLLSWYDQNKRDLPWRNYAQTPGITKQDHAYAVWVSEIMLQQTRVATVLGYYERWMKEWPDLNSLSQSTVEAVNQMWAGLGYYSRGRRLREGAIKIVEELGNKFPENSTEMMKLLPGVGKYTAAAISSIAFNEKVGVLDGNVTRVLCRLRTIGGNSTSKDVILHLWNLTDAIVDDERPGDFNQAIMELGATVCTPKSPNCSNCPLNKHCWAYMQVQKHNSNNNLFKPNEEKIKKENLEENNWSEPISENKIQPSRKIVKQEKENIKHLKVKDIEDLFALSSDWDPVLGVTNYPFKPKKKAPRQEYTTTCVIELKDQTGESKWLVTKRPPTGLLAGLWEFPNDVITQIKNETKGKKRLASGEEISSNFSSKKIKTDLKQFSDTILKKFNKNSYKIIDRTFKGKVVHIFSHISQTNYVEHIQLQSIETLNNEVVNFKWLTPQELASSATSSGVLKIFKLCSSDSKTENSYGRNKAKKVKIQQKDLLSYFTKK